ncbi:MAG: methionyl-tRNA formyltransferase [Thermomicrobiales bacterium]
MERAATGWRVVMFTATPAMPPAFEPVLRAMGHRVVGLVTAPGPRSRRTDGYLGVAQLARPDLDVIVSNHPDRYAAMIAPLHPDLILTVGYNWIIPADVLALPRLGAINVHDALLPRNRGPNATGWALRNGDPKHGSTIHRMTPRLDDGPILAQASVSLTDDDDIDTLWPRLTAAFPDAFREALARIAAGDPGTPQREEDATEAPRFETDWLYLDWSRSARDLHLQIRSWRGTRDAPRGAIGTIDGVPTRVLKARLVDAPNSGAAPGTVLRRDGETLLIQCGDRPLLILRHQPEPAEGAAPPARTEGNDARQ